MSWPSFFGKVLNFLDNNVLELWGGGGESISEVTRKTDLYLLNLTAAVSIHSKIIFLAVP